MTSKQDLLEALKEAEGPSRELDAMVAVTVDKWEWHGDGSAVEFQSWAGHWVQPSDEGSGTFDANGICDCVVASGQEPPHYTSFLDACLALQERVLPGWLWSVESCADGMFYAELVDPAEDNCFPSEAAKAPTPAFALLIAIVKALITQEQNQ